MKDKIENKPKTVKIDNLFDAMFFWLSIAAFDYSSGVIEKDKKTEAVNKVQLQRNEKEYKK